MEGGKLPSLNFWRHIFYSYTVYIFPKQATVVLAMYKKLQLSIQAFWRVASTTAANFFPFTLPSPSPRCSPRAQTDLSCEEGEEEEDFVEF